MLPAARIEEYIRYDLGAGMAGLIDAGIVPKVSRRERAFSRRQRVFDAKSRMTDSGQVP